MHAAFAALLALPSALAGEPRPPVDEEPAWTALPLPRVCHSEVRSPRLVRLAEGRHILLPGEFQDLEGAPAPPRLPVPQLLGLLQSEASARRMGVRFQASAPPVLVRGAPAEVASLRALVDDVERATASWRVDLQAWITPGASDAGTHPSAEAFQRAVGPAVPWGAAAARSGEEIVLGQRSLHPFTADFRVEVAQDSGVAAARAGRFVVGRTLHLRAHRSSDGGLVHLDGFLDWSEVAGVEEFETGNHELGVLEQPRLQGIQVAFSGVVPGGGVLAVAAAGAPLSMADWTLWVRASTAEPGGGGAWEALDLALLERAPDPLPAPDPGGGLRGEGSEAERFPGLDRLPAAALAQAGDMVRGERGARPTIVWAPGLVLAPAAEVASWNEMRSLASAAESVRLRDASLRVARGPLRVTLPVAEGCDARVLAARERVLLTGYRVEVAPESWMPVPLVETSLDGLLVQGRLLEGAWVCAAWSARSGPVRVLERPQVNVGRQQSVERAFHAADMRVEAGASARGLTGAADPPLELTLGPSGGR